MSYFERFEIFFQITKQNSAQLLIFSLLLIAAKMTFFAFIFNFVWLCLAASGQTTTGRRRGGWFKIWRWLISLFYWIWIAFAFAWFAVSAMRLVVFVEDGRQDIWDDDWGFFVLLLFFLLVRLLRVLIYCCVTSLLFLKSDYCSQGLNFICHLLLKALSLYSTNFNMTNFYLLFVTINYL